MPRTAAIDPPPFDLFEPLDEKSEVRSQKSEGRPGEPSACPRGPDRPAAQTAPAQRPLSPVRARFEAAVAAFVEKVKQDRLVIAAILGGSLSHDEVWEKSDVDMVLVGKEEVKKTRSLCLVEDGINFHVILLPRSEYKKIVEGQLQGSFMTSFLAKSTLLFSHDETFAEYYENAGRIGSRDVEMQLLKGASGLLYFVYKAEKWLRIKDDLPYCTVWLLGAAQQLAHVEVLLRGEMPGREVIQQAMPHNPELFQKVYLDLLDAPKDRERVTGVLQTINDYLDARATLLFAPVLEYLSLVGSARSATEMDEHFKKRAQTSSLSIVYEWLADRDIIRKVSTPVKLTEKSRVSMDEAAYYYDGDS